MIDAGLHFNMKDSAAIMRDGGIIDYCQLKKITIQAWSPFLIDLQKGVFVNHPDYAVLNAVLQDIAERYQVSYEAIVVAWLLRHPATIQVVVGSMNPDRLMNITQAIGVNLNREEWYEIYRSAGNYLP